MINIDFNNRNDGIVYEAFHVDVNEAEALNDRRIFCKGDRGRAE